MKKIHLCKREPLYGQEPEPVTIFIDRELPNLGALQKEVGNNIPIRSPASFYQAEAKALVKVLHNALPQGTFDWLGIEFMKKKVSLKSEICGQ